eukprot:364039-Chlamydomonas_euryale.AAC.2
MRAHLPVHRRGEKGLRVQPWEHRRGEKGLRVQPWEHGRREGGMRAHLRAYRVTRGEGHASANTRGPSAQRGACLARCSCASFWGLMFARMPSELVRLSACVLSLVINGTRFGPGHLRACACACEHHRSDVPASPAALQTFNNAWLPQDPSPCACPPLPGASDAEPSASGSEDSIAAGVQAALDSADAFRCGPQTPSGISPGCLQVWPRTPARAGALESSCISPSRCIYINTRTHIHPHSAIASASKSTSICTSTSTPAYKYTSTSTPAYKYTSTPAYKYTSMFTSASTSTFTSSPEALCGTYHDLVIQASTRLSRPEPANSCRQDVPEKRPQLPPGCA